MNVLNVSAVEAWCAAASARFGPSAEEAAWVRSQLRRHVLRTAALHVRVDGPEAAEGALEGDDVPAWLPEALARGDAVVAFDPSCPAAAALAEEVAGVADWSRGEPGAPALLARMSVADAVGAARAWHRREAVRRARGLARRLRVTERAAHAMLSRRDPQVAALWPDDPTGVVEVHAFPDGAHRVVELRSAAALDREGTLLDHCVGTYAQAVADGRTRILSLRDASNLPLATVEVTPLRRASLGGRAFLLSYVPPGAGLVQQVRGLSNEAPEAWASAMVDAYAASEGLATRAGGGWERLVDVAAMARDGAALEAADGRPAAVRPGPRVSHLLSALARHAGDVDPGTVDAAAALLAPHPGHVAVEETTTRLGAVTLTTRRVTLPCGAFSPVAVAVASARPGPVSKGLAEVAAHVLRIVAGDPKVLHVVEASTGARPVPEAFFAAGGLLAEWVAARDANALSARAHLAAASSHARRALLTVRDPAERHRLHNVVNVVIPALLRGPRAGSPTVPAPGGTVARAGSGPRPG